MHIQNDHGLYSDPPELFCTEIPFDSDRFFTLTTGNKTGRVLHSLADMNSDGIADMVIYTLSGQRISKKRSSFSIYYGQSAEGNSTRINNNIGTTFESEDRIQLRLERRDFNRDGQMDLMLTTIERERLYGSLWKTLKGMMGDDIALNLDFHQSIEGFQTTKPNTTYRIALDGAPATENQVQSISASSYEVPLMRVAKQKKHGQRHSTRICLSEMSMAMVTTIYSSSPRSEA